MKLVTFDDGKVGRVEGDTIVQLDVPDMRTVYERGQQADETGATFPLADVRLRAPIIPKKFFHTAGNFQEHHERSRTSTGPHPVLPWIVFPEHRRDHQARRRHRLPAERTHQRDRSTSSSLRS